MHILLVEDDQSFGYILKAYLELYSLKVTWVRDSIQSLKLIKEFPFELIILDIMLPEVDGYSIAKKIKEVSPEIPFIFLTAKSLKVDKLLGYKLGCDDFITKPVDEELLLAKIQAILKRSYRHKRYHVDEEKQKIGNYEFDFQKLKLSINGKPRHLTEKEALLLRLLNDNFGHLVKRDYALKKIWGRSDFFNRRTMDVFISRLRKYLIEDPNIQIRNVHSKGFILEEKSSP